MPSEDRQFRNDRFPAIHCAANTLVEMLIAIALSGLLLGIVVSSLVSLQRYHQSTHNRSLERAEIYRLTHTLRQDMRQAAEIRRADQHTLVVLTTADSEVHYTLRDDFCHRTVQDDAGGVTRRDSYTLGPVAGWRIESPRERSAATSVWLERAPREEDRSPLPAVHIVATRDSAP